MAEAGQLSILNTQHSTAEIIGILHKWGIHTLGELAALNKEELRDRLGVEAVRLWERANGTATRLLKFVHPPESFDESFEFDHEIETAEPLLFILRRFLEQIALRLSSIYLVARELTLRITFSDKKIYERIFKIPQPTNEVDLLFRMLQTHLENLAAARSEHPIVAVALSAEPIRPVSQQFGLFETALRNPQQLYETLARLTALLGSDRVGTPVLEETHRPDAFRMEAFDWNVGGTISVSSHNSDTIHSTSSGQAQRVPPRASPSRTGTVNRPYLNDEGNPTTRRSSLQIALRRFRPPASVAIFISEGRYLGGEAGESKPDWHWQSPLPKRRRENASPARTCRHRRSDEIRGKIVDQAGPFLLSGNWWDEKAWARAEWDMQLENGEIVRVHEADPPSKRASPPSSDYGATDSADGVWKLDGIYD